MPPIVPPPLPLSLDGQPDWPEVHAQLARLQGDELEDLADAVVEAAQQDHTGPEVQRALITTLNRATSAFGKRNAAMALAHIAPPDQEDALDALSDAYRAHRSDPFLASAMLTALGALALTSAPARAQVTVFLHRLRPENERYVLVAAARIIGSLDALDPDENLRGRLTALVQASDVLVQAEVVQQSALIRLGDALRATDEVSMRAELVDAAAGFARAQQLEEHRPDAALFAGLLRAVLAFLDVANHADRTAEQLLALHKELETSWQTAAMYDIGLASPVQRRLVSWALRVTSALHAAATAASDWEGWLDQVLVDLAQCHAHIRADVTVIAAAGHVPRSMPDLADVIFAAALGPVLRRAVTLKRLESLRAAQSQAHGENDITRGLDALEAATRAVPYTDLTIQDPMVRAHFTNLATRNGWSTAELWTNVTDALERGSPDALAEHLQLTPALPFAHEGLLGGLPDIDEVVRPVLVSASAVLSPYPDARWRRLSDVLINVVRFVQDQRDVLPDYLRSADDKGKGRDATEGDLQRALWTHLRDRYGKAVDDEREPFGGGRVDVCVTFPEGQFPIEVKREFDDVSPAHLREHYLPQADRYAAVAHRVALLMVLDLRHHGPVKRRRMIRAPDAELPAGLYTLAQSFFVEHLPADPQLPQMQPNVVIVGLVPGNLPRPSTMTRYSGAKKAP